jgi:hypothetical protein
LKAPDNEAGFPRSLEEVTMNRLLQTCLVASVCALSSAAAAQQSCPEGRTASGQCVNAGLALSMRQDAIIFAQPKISHTAFPVLPSADWQYRYPNNLIHDPQPPSAAGTGPRIVNGGFIIF